MYGASVSLMILQQPDKARLQLKNITNITWTMQVGCSLCSLFTLVIQKLRGLVMLRLSGWRLGKAVASFIAWMKLLYVEPG